MLSYTNGTAGERLRGLVGTSVARLMAVAFVPAVDTPFSIGNTSTAVTLSLANGQTQTATLTGNCTFTMPTATAGASLVLFLYTGAGSFTGTFTGVKWPAGFAPVITTTASRMDIVSFVSDGTSWYGNFVQDYTP